jgi:hypothetical protein
MDSPPAIENNDSTIQTNGDEISLDKTETNRIKKNLEKYEQLFGIDEESSGQPTTTRKELWSYYLYCNVSAVPP